MKSLTVTVKGMHCSSCGILIDETLEELAGVKSSTTNVRRERTKVEFDPATTDETQISQTIAALGYEARLPG